MDPTKASILVVDDERNIRRTLRMVLEAEGYAVLEAESAEQGLEVLQSEPVDLGVFDIRLPGMDGLALLSRARELWRDLPVIMISGHADTSDVVDAVKRGATDFFSKPVDRDRVLVSVRNALSRRDLEGKVQALSARERRFSDDMLGESPAMRKLREDIGKVAPTSGRVLILGESGTGKELVAAEVHRQSRRADGPFVKVNCAAIPSELIESELFGHEKGSFSGAAARRRGQFEVAHGGTLFLDEIGDMGLSAQAKVLRALQTGEVVRVGSEKAFTVDVRIIAATNKDLEEEVRNGAFREDLFFRLNVVPLTVPPLRDRLDDVPVLAERFFQLATRENGLRPKPVDAAVYERLKQHRWPGNVRELRNVCERMVIMCGERITAEDVPETVGPRAASPPPPGSADLSRYGEVPLKELRDLVERDYILARLEEHDWNITQAAQALGVVGGHLHRHFSAQRVADHGDAAADAQRVQRLHHVVAHRAQADGRRMRRPAVVGQVHTHDGKAGGQSRADSAPVLTRAHQPVQNRHRLARAFALGVQNHGRTECWKNGTLEARAASVSSARRTRKIPTFQYSILPTPLTASSSTPERSSCRACTGARWPSGRPARRSAWRRPAPSGGPPAAAPSPAPARSRG
jgi:DNA-binding NtrC family response regulator